MRYFIDEQVVNTIIKAIGDLPVTWNQANPIIVTLSRNITPVPEETKPDEKEKKVIHSGLKKVQATETATGIQDNATQEG